MSDRPSVTFSVELPEEMAFALAELCKRIGWSDCRANAVSDAEAQRMVYATDRIRSSLEAAGVSVR